MTRISERAPREGDAAQHPAYGDGTIAAVKRL